MALTYKRSLISKYNRFIDPDFGQINGIWSWFTSPSCIYHNGYIFIGAVDSVGNVIIYKVSNTSYGSSSFTLKATLEVDDHDYPSIIVRPDRKFQCFYSAHNGANMFYRISTNPDDITAWDAEQTLGTNTAGANGYTYSNIFYLSSENKYYLFWRGADWLPAYSTSTNGTTWETAATFFSVGGGQRPYLRYCSNNTDTIHFVATDGHPNAVNTNLYYFYYRNNNFYKADGTLIKSISSVPLLTSEVDKIYDYATNSNRKCWIWDIATDSNGYPVIVYTNFYSTTDHRYRYIRWNGSTWIDNEVDVAGTYLYAAEAYYSAGICLDHSNPNVIYYINKNDNKFTVKKATTSDNGINWTILRLGDSTTPVIRPISILNNPGDKRIVVTYGSYNTYTNYNTNIGHD